MPSPSRSPPLPTLTLCPHWRMPPLVGHAALVGQAFQPALAPFAHRLSSTQSRPLQVEHAARLATPASPWSAQSCVPHQMFAWSTQSCVPRRQSWRRMASAPRCPALGRKPSLWASLFLWCRHSDVGQASRPAAGFPAGLGPLYPPPLFRPIASSVGADRCVRPRRHRSVVHLCSHILLKIQPPIYELPISLDRLTESFVRLNRSNESYV